MQSPISSNRFLAALSPADAEALLRHLGSVHLEKGTVLCETGEPVRSVYFPQDGIISLIVDLGSGEPIEVASIGRDSVVGAAAALGSPLAVSRAVVQIGGPAASVDADAVAALARESAPLRALLVRHEQFLFAQAQQTAACNALHTIEARLARCLLRCRTLLRNEEISLTQDAIADVLGVRRTSISLVAGTMQSAGLIGYRRGRIRVLDMRGLEAAACECHRAIDRQYANLLVGEPSTAVRRPMTA